MTKSHEALNQNQISGYFRANVGILIINKEGLVLAAERSERPGAWQLPQGGIDQGEEEEQAALREMQEELGFDKQNIKDLLQPLGTHPSWFAYQLPKKDWSGKNGRGQAQKFFAYRFTGQDDQLDEKFSASKEFSAWKWVNMPDLIDVAWEIRRPVYEALAQVFSKYLAGNEIAIIDNKEAGLIWEEYKYRHEHVWKTVFSLTGAVILLSFIPYLYPRVTCVLEWRIGIPLIVGVVLYLFGITRLFRELKRFDKIKSLYRDYQYEKYNFEKSIGNFSRDVKIYLLGLGAVTLGNICIFIYWLYHIDCNIFVG